MQQSTTLIITQNLIIILSFLTVQKAVIIAEEIAIISSTQQGIEIESSTISDFSTTRTTNESENDDVNKFIGSTHEIILEHTDFVTLRLRHLLNQTSSDIPTLRALQEIEFNTSSTYKDGWEVATQIYNETKKALIQTAFVNSSIILNAPEEYHIALIAYTGSSLYYDFNSKTRALCSGYDIDEYAYKSLFKLLELAIESLGPEIQRLTWNNNSSRPGESVLYRGVSKIFALNIGQKLAFQHFISTSRNPSVAQGFSWGDGATVFEIHAERQHPLRHGIYLGIHSVYSGEEEVLLSPLQIFEVESIAKSNENGVVHAVLRTKSYLPSPTEDCNLILEILKGSQEYQARLKLAVSILGAVLATFLLVGGALSLHMVIKGKKFGYKIRTNSELQLT